MEFQPQPGRIVLTVSADAVLDPDLSDGAVRLLMLIRSLAGHSRVLVTLTQSLATQLRRHPDTIRDWRGQLEAGDYISSHTDPHSGRSTILVREAVEPPSRRALMAAQREEDVRPAPLPWQTPRLVILKPDPKPWGTLPQARPWRNSRAAAWAGQLGAGRGRDIKTRKILFPVPSATEPGHDSAAALTALPASGTGRGWEAQPPVRTPTEQIAAVMRAAAQAASAKPVPAWAAVLPRLDRLGLPVGTAMPDGHTVAVRPAMGAGRWS